MTVGTTAAVLSLVRQELVQDAAAMKSSCEIGYSGLLTISTCDAWEFPLSRSEKVDRCMFLLECEVRRMKKKVIDLEGENEELRRAVDVATAAAAARQWSPPKYFPEEEQFTPPVSPTFRSSAPAGISARPQMRVRRRTTIFQMGGGGGQVVRIPRRTAPAGCGPTRLASNSPDKRHARGRSEAVWAKFASDDDDDNMPPTPHITSSSCSPVRSPIRGRRPLSFQQIQPEQVLNRRSRRLSTASYPAPDGPESTPPMQSTPEPDLDFPKRSRRRSSLMTVTGSDGQMRYLPSADGVLIEVWDGLPPGVADHQLTTDYATEETSQGEVSPMEEVSPSEGFGTSSPRKKIRESAGSRSSFLSAVSEQSNCSDAEEDPDAGPDDSLMEESAASLFLDPAPEPAAGTEPHAP